MPLAKHSSMACRIYLSALSAYFGGLFGQVAVFCENDELESKSGALGVFGRLAPDWNNDCARGVHILMSEPAWIEDLVENVGDCIEPHSMMGPLGFYYGDDEECWEITVYPCLIELVGIGADAEVVSPAFSMDVKSLWSAFDEIVDIRWNTHPLGPHDRDGAYIAVEGRYQGHAVWLRILAHAPEDEEPAMQIDASTFVTEDAAKMH